MALFAGDITAPVELTTAVFRLPHGPETAPTAEHVAATSAGCVGALASLGAHRACLSVGKTKVGRPLREDYVLHLWHPRAHVFGHESFAGIVGNHLNGLVKLVLQPTAHFAQTGKCPPASLGHTGTTHTVALALVHQVIFHRLKHLV